MVINRAYSSRKASKLKWEAKAAVVTMKELFWNLQKYRELIWALALKELTIRYKRSVLGFLWALLNPMLLMIVMSVVFSTIMAAGIHHYAIFILSALVPWMFFSQSLTYAVESIVGNADLIKKVSVPKIVFPVAAVLSNVINLMLSLIPLALIVLLLGHPFYWTWILLPIYIVALAIFTLGCSLFFATANVYYRDVAHIVQIVMNMWFYLTPILYTIEQIPARWRWLFKFNPIIFVLNDFRLSVYWGLLPTFWSVVASFLCAGLAFLIGYAFFRKHQSEFVFYV
ncbi:MAG: type transporter [Bryobacterales bacterium]|nr:type transporter [Bryobacterales bacterium]